MFCLTHSCTVSAVTDWPTQKAAAGFSSHSYHCQATCVAAVKQFFVMKLKTEFRLNSIDLCWVALLHT